MEWRARSPHRLSAALILISALIAPSGSRSESLSEYGVKAIYLTKFVPFIEWPNTPDNAPVTICILGEDPFGPAIDKAASLASGAGRTVTVRRISSTDTADAAVLSVCQMAYVGDPLAAIDVLDTLQAKPIVTVTDSGIRTRGTISFVMADSHVRFDIDDAQAEKNGIHVSSKLLELAHAVTRKGEGR